MDVDWRIFSGMEIGEERVNHIYTVYVYTHNFSFTVKQAISSSVISRSCNQVLSNGIKVSCWRKQRELFYVDRTHDWPGTSTTLPQPVLIYLPVHVLYWVKSTICIYVPYRHLFNCCSPIFDDSIELPLTSFILARFHSWPIRDVNNAVSCQ